MFSDRSSVIEGLDREDMHRVDMQDIAEPVLKTIEEQTDRDRMEMHSHHNPHDHAHVDLGRDEYLPEEVARMLGTSLEVVMHAIWRGELAAERKGRNIICIPRAALCAWLANWSKAG